MWDLDMVAWNKRMYKKVKSLRSKLSASSYRRILKISWNDKVNDQEVLKRIQSKSHFMTYTMKRKMRYVGHVLTLLRDSSDLSPLVARLFNLTSGTIVSWLCSQCTDRLLCWWWCFLLIKCPLAIVFVFIKYLSDNLRSCDSTSGESGDIFRQLNNNKTSTYSAKFSFLYYTCYTLYNSRHFCSNLTNSKIFNSWASMRITVMHVLLL